MAAYFAYCFCLYWKKSLIYQYSWHLFCGIRLRKYIHSFFIYLVSFSVAEHAVLSLSSCFLFKSFKFLMGYDSHVQETWILVILLNNGESKGFCFITSPLVIRFLQCSAPLCNTVFTLSSITTANIVLSKSNNVWGFTALALHHSQPFLFSFHGEVSTNNYFNYSATELWNSPSSFIIIRPWNWLQTFNFKRIYINNI